MHVLSLHTTLSLLIHIQFTDPLFKLFSFLESIFVWTCFNNYTFPGTYLATIILSSHIHYLFMWSITCISSWKQRLGIISFVCASVRDGRGWWLSVGSGGRPLADIWLSSVLAVSPLASSFTFLLLHVCICTMGQVITEMASESHCCEVWANECPKNTNRHAWYTVHPQYTSLIRTSSRPGGVLCTLMMSLSLSEVHASSH